MEEIITKKCCQCGQIKPLEEFVKDNRRKDGHSTLCKECKRARDRARYHERKDDPEYHAKRLEHQAKYRKNHKEQIDDYSYEYNARPEVIERKAEWYQEKTYKRSISTKIGDMITRAKKRALEKNVPFNLVKEDIKYTDMCPLLNIPLNWEGGPRNKNTPSLDRIIPELGYIKGNVRIISNLANMMKSYASFEELTEFSKNINKYMKNEEIVRTIENSESIEQENKESLG